MSINKEIEDDVRKKLEEAQQQLQALSSPKQIVHEEFFDSWSGDVAVGNEERQNLRDRIEALQRWLREENLLAEIREVVDSYEHDHESADAAITAVKKIQSILGDSDSLD